MGIRKKNTTKGNNSVKDIIDGISLDNVVEVSIKRIIPVMPVSMSNIDTSIKFSDEMPIICDKKNVIIEGHGIYWWNKHNGIKRIKVIYIERPTNKMLSKQVAKLAKRKIKSAFRETISGKTRLNINPVFGISLNKINSDITTYLKSDFEITGALKKGDVLLQHYVAKVKADSFFLNRVLIQPVDGTLIAKPFVKQMNEYDMIVVPAYSCEKLLIQSGVHKGIITIPNYYEDEIFTASLDYYSTLINHNSKYTFYSESTGIKRKNIDNILKYYLSTFSDRDNVRLIIKLSASKKVYDKLVEQVAAVSKAPEVIILNEFISDADLNSLRNGIDCYVCLSYMEGFCIPLLNALILKKDAIALKSEISGYMDFTDSSNAILLEPKKITIDQSAESLLIYDKKSEWEEPNDYNDYSKALSDAFTKNYSFDKELRLTDLKAKYNIKNVMMQYHDLFSKFMDDDRQYQREIKTTSVIQEKVVKKYEEGKFLNPIVVDVYMYLDILTVKGWTFTKVIDMTGVNANSGIYENIFKVTGQFDGVNVQGKINTLDGEFTIRVDDSGNKFHVHTEGARSKFGDDDVAKFFIEIESNNPETVPDFLKVGNGVFIEGVRRDGIVVIKSDDNYSPSYTTEADNPEKPDPRPAPGGDIPDTDTDEGPDDGPVTRPITNSTGWTDGGSAKITEVDSNTVRWASFKLLNVNGTGAPAPVTLAGDFIVTDKDEKIVISVDNGGSGVYVQEYPFKVNTLSLIIQTADQFRTNISGSFTSASGTAEVEAVSTDVDVITKDKP